MTEEHEQVCPIQKEGCPYPEKESFFVKNLGAIIAILISLIGWAFTLGTYTVRLSNIEAEHQKLEHKVELLESDGSSTAKQTAWSVEEHSKRITQLESDMRTVNTNINEMKSDLRIIVEWVTEQKKRQDLTLK